MLVGRAIAGRRDQVQLATKVGMDRSSGTFVWRGERAYVKRGCEASLLRLGVDVIDLYSLHRPPTTNDIEETIAAMADSAYPGRCDVSEASLCSETRAPQPASSQGAEGPG